MKKLIFAGVAVMLALTIVIVSCDFTPTALDDDEFAQYHVNNAMLTGVTIRLEGGGPSRNMPRALSHALARQGHDYYEVVFVYEADGDISGSPIIARTSWERGAGAAIRGVFRNSAGVDYTATNIAEAQAVPTPTPVVPAAAIMFVGTRTGELLAVGKLAAGSTINYATETVTFEIVALQAGINTTLASSSFFIDNSHTAWSTPPSETTTVDFFKPDFDLGGYKFPLYYLKNGITVAAQYTIDTVDSTGALGSVTPAQEITKYTPGIMVRDNTTSRIDFISPRMYSSGVYYNWTAPMINMGSSIIAFNNNNTADAAFDEKIQFTFTTPDYPALGVIGLSVKIPVYAITKNAPEPGGTPAKDWFIQPGLGPSFYTLDDGRGGQGGAILLGVGTVDGLNIIGTWLP